MTMISSHAAEKESMMQQFNVEKEILMSNFAKQGYTWKEASRENQAYRQQVESLSASIKKISSEAQRLQRHLDETESKHTPCV